MKKKSPVKVVRPNRRKWRVTVGYERSNAGYDQTKVVEGFDEVVRFLQSKMSEGMEPIEIIVEEK